MMSKLPCRAGGLDHHVDGHVGPGPLPIAEHRERDHIVAEPLDGESDRVLPQRGGVTGGGAWVGVGVKRPAHLGEVVDAALCRISVEVFGVAGREPGVGGDAGVAPLDLPSGRGERDDVVDPDTDREAAGAVDGNRVGLLEERAACL